jgi:hypothetical protein
MRAKRISYVSMLLVILFIQAFLFSLLAQDYTDQNNILLLKTILQLEKNISKSDEDIRRYEKEIIKCDKTIATSEKIIGLAREQGNSDAEKIAKDALLKSTTAKEKNIKLLNSAKLRKQQSEIILESIKSKLSDNSKNAPIIDAVALNYYGDISIVKHNGEQFKLNETQNSLLENGDVVTTSENSKVELQFLEGRGNIIVGENSKLKFNKQDSTDLVEVIKGKVKLGVQKIDEYEKYLMEQYEKYKETVTSIPESYEQFKKTYRAKIQKKLEVRFRGGTCSIRGTEFIVNTNDDYNTEIIVLEGTVEMKSTISLKTILINAGQKGIINDEGILSESTKIDVSKIEKWWEDEE